MRYPMIGVTGVLVVAACVMMVRATDRSPLAPSVAALVELANRNSWNINKIDLGLIDLAQCDELVAPLQMACGIPYTSSTFISLEDAAGKAQAGESTPVRISTSQATGYDAWSGAGLERLNTLAVKWESTHYTGAGVTVLVLIVSDGASAVHWVLGAAPGKAPSLLSAD